MSAPLWLEAKYVNIMSPRLERFKRVGDYIYTFRCPYCNDSKTDKNKTRGYIYQRDGHLKFKCHNCGVTNSALGLLKDIDPYLFEEFKLEALKESGNKFSVPYDIIIPKEKIFNNKNILFNLKNILEFPLEHPIRKYVDNRLIPLEAQKNIYFTIRFMEWVNTILPDKFMKSQLKIDEPRLIFPFFDVDKKIFAVTGRSFKSKSIKYITIKFDEDQNKIFGLDRIDKSKRVYIVEGPIDSLFIENSIAFAGSSGYIPEFEDSVIVLDNEPRNKEIVKLVHKFISQGRNVCIWPPYFKFKDINEGIVGGYSQEEIKTIIDNNTFVGMKASLKFSEWRIVH